MASYWKNGGRYVRTRFRIHDKLPGHLELEAAWSGVGKTASGGEQQLEGGPVGKFTTYQATAGITKGVTRQMNVSSGIRVSKGHHHAEGNH